MSWVWVLLVPFPGAVLVIPVLCAAGAAGNACRWLHQMFDGNRKRGVTCDYCGFTRIHHEWRAEDVLAVRAAGTAPGAAILPDLPPRVYA